MSNRIMDPRVKELWLKALRSGSFPQGKNYLEDSGTYCCLGVLCTIAQAENVVIRQPVSVNTDRATFVSIEDDTDYNSQVLPRVVQDWAQISDDTGDIYISREDYDNLKLSCDEGELISSDDGETVRTSLTGLNDYGATFEQIAYLIEEYL